MFHYWNNHDIS